jgi:hypothetical protein
MYLYFDKEGVLKTKIDHGEKLRQGGDLHITVCLDYDFWLAKGWHIGERNSALMSLKIVTPQGLDGVDATVSTIDFTPDGPLDGELSTFERLYGSEVVYNLIPGNVYLMYKFHVPASTSRDFWGKVELHFTAANDLTTQDYVKIAETTIWNKGNYKLANGERGIAYSYNTQTQKIEAKVRTGTSTINLWNLLANSESTVNVGEDEPVAAPETNTDELYVRAKYNATKQTIDFYDVWQWNPTLGIWEMLVLYSPSDTVIDKDGSVERYPFSPVEVLVEKTVGYNRSIIDQQVSVRYNDIMGELKKAFAKIAVASTKPDWKEEDATSPAYIRNKPTIADQGEVDKNFEEVNKKLTKLEARPIGTQIMDGTELVKTIKKSDIIFADDEIIINGGEA